MKGLLKNNFYGVIENLKIALAFVMLVGVLLLITGEATLLSAFSLIAPPIIALLMVSCVRKESASKWEKYKLTLPVRRKAIIESQGIPVCVLRRGMGRQHDFGVDDFTFMGIVFLLLVVFRKQPFPALVGGRRNG